MSDTIVDVKIDLTPKTIFIDMVAGDTLSFAITFGSVANPWDLTGGSHKFLLCPTADGTATIVLTSTVSGGSGLTITGDATSTKVVIILSKTATAALKDSTLFLAHQFTDSAGNMRTWVDGWASFRSGVLAP